MPELKEVFGMVTKQTEPDVDSWREQERRQRRTARNRKIGGFAVTAVIGLAAAMLILLDIGRAPAPPAVQPDTPAEELVTRFLEAYGAFNAERAITFLADDADISGLVASVGEQGMQGTPEELPLLISMLEAERYEQALSACVQTRTFGSNTEVRCAFAFHLLGSRRYVGSHFSVTVRDGEIVAAEQHWDTERFSAETWEPFARWVSRTHPDDVQAMYTDAAMSGVRLTERSVQLWARRTGEFLQAYAPVGPVPTDQRFTGIVDSVPFSLDVSSPSWEQFGTISINKSITGPQGAEAILFWTAFPDGAASPCANLPSSSGDPAAVDLVSAMSTAPGVELVARPSDVTLGGLAAKHVAWRVTEDTGCDPGFFFTWHVPLAGALWSDTRVGDTIHLWIVDVDGTLLVFEAMTSEDADAALEQEVQEFVGSIRFD
jgi:hypothetical protein